MKLTLINCYFGSLPNYFNLWLDSCRWNREVVFAFVTDAELSTYDIPVNVTIERIEKKELLHRIENAVGFDVNIDSPYKLTDFKPVFGLIFENILIDSDYWGYCDIDMVFGDIMQFVEPIMKMGYEKIYRLGHLTIYKNNEKMKRLFEKPGGAFNYHTVFKNKEFFSFDEHAGLMTIARKENIHEYYEENMADISCRIKRMTASRHINYSYQVFYAENGKVYRAYINDVGQVETEEFIYIHFQKRKYRIDVVCSPYYFLSGCITKKTMGIPTADEIIENSEFVSYEEDEKQILNFRKQKLKSFLKCTVKEKQIWLKQKLYEKAFDKVKV